MQKCRRFLENAEGLVSLHGSCTTSDRVTKGKQATEFIFIKLILQVNALQRISFLICVLKYEHIIGVESSGNNSGKVSDTETFGGLQRKEPTDFFKSFYQYLQEFEIFVN